MVILLGPSAIRIKNNMIDQQAAEEEHEAAEASL